MRLEQQNRRSCIGLLVFLALLAALILWASLGGVPRDTPGNGVQADVDGPSPPPGAAAPEGTTMPPPTASRP
jgi:hypothetical protein